MKSVLYEHLVNDLRNIAATRDLSAGDVTNISDAAWLIEAMQSRIADLEKDAARYLKLVESGNFVPATLSPSRIWGFRASGSQSTKQELDAAVDAIDTAMQKD